MNPIDMTGTTAEVLSDISKARGEPINDTLMQQLCALCGEQQSMKFLVFVDALARLCNAHGVTLSTSGYDGLQVWDADANSGPIHCAGIKDCMKPTRR